MKLKVCSESLVRVLIDLYIWRREAGVCVDLRDNAFLIKLRTAANIMCDKHGAAVGCVLTRFWATFCLFIPSPPHPPLRPNTTCSFLRPSVKYSCDKIRSLGDFTFKRCGISLSSAPRYPKEHCFVKRFPGFSHLPF
jgi:hypothetical protein